MTQTKDASPANAPRKNDRIAILDGIRAMSIVLVMFFHYFSRWTPPRSPVNLYPYGQILSGFPLARYGYLGVELFFVVSGFVISLTLFSSSGPWDFARKRLARLLPSMLLCSVASYVLLLWLPVKIFAPEPIDFVSSWTFVEPELLERIFHRKFGVVDGVYWSLFVEVKFYFWACLLHFAVSSRRFLATFAVFFNAVLALRLATNALANRELAGALEFLFFPDYLPWFTAGVAFYYLYRDRADRLALLVVAESALVLSVGQMLSAERWEVLAFTVSAFALFFAFVYRPTWLEVLARRPVTDIGAASYSLYLLHQAVGVTFIVTLGQWLGLASRTVSILLVPAVAVLLTILSITIYRAWETPLKRLILRKTAA